MRKLKMIDNELSEKFKLVLEKELNAITKEMTKNSKTKLSDLIRDNFEDFQLIVKIRRSKNLGGYEYLAYLLSSSGIETSAETLKTLMNRVQKEKNKTKKTQPTQNMMLEPVVKLTEPAPQPTKPELPHIDPDVFRENMKTNRYYFRDLPDDYHDDKTYALLAMEENPTYQYDLLSLRLKLDHDVALKTINQSFFHSNLVKSLYDDREFMMKALPICGGYYNEMSDRLKKDKHLAILALKKNPHMYRWIQKNIYDIDIAKLAIELYPDNIKYLTPELKLALKIT